MRKILLNQYKSQEEVNKTPILRVNLSNNKKLTDDGQYYPLLNEYDIYLDERLACKKIRMTAQINVVASNVLCNSITEIVKDEDSDKCQCLNFTPKAIPTTLGKEQSYKWGNSVLDCINDTQITFDGDTNKNYTYLCGFDMLNNHILRSKSYTPIYLPDNDNSVNYKFNTIEDYARDFNGRKVLSTTKTKTSKNGTEYMHAYSKSNIMSWLESTQKNIVNNNGWFGFLNKGRFSFFSDNKDLGIANVVNNQPTNQFIPFYPNSSHFAFTPYYNESRNRLEKNWEYCLCYPKENVTSGIACINENINTLKIAFIDENTMDTDGLYKNIIFSLSKHGLKEGDTINIYRSSEDNSISELIEENIVVSGIIDDYTFFTYLSENICRNWIDCEDKYSLNQAQLQNVSNTNKYLRNDIEGEYVLSYNGFINADFDDLSQSKIGSQNLSFAKVENGVKVQYYVRVLSRFPNFEFMDGEVSQSTIYAQNDEGILNIDEYSKPEYEKQSTLNKLSFSKSVYNDNLYNLTYTDDIEFDNIKDNLGRPLTSLYLYVMKTNYGHEDWYNGDVTSENVEHSHCFGKITSGFEFNPILADDKYIDQNVHLMHNLGKKENGNVKYYGILMENGSDELHFDNVTTFYGDLCMYSPSQLSESVLQPVVHRFNTQQRELSGTSYLMKDKFKAVNANEIVSDDSSKYNFSVTTETVDSKPTSKKEGWFYQASYEIPIRSFGANINAATPLSYNVCSISSVSDGTYIFKLATESSIQHGSEVVLYDKVNEIPYACQVENILATNVITLQIQALDSGNIVPENYILYHKTTKIPSYATYTPEEGYGVYKWRELFENGFDDEGTSVPEYPFTNNSLYVNQLFTILVKRQDPFGFYGLNDEARSNSIGGMGKINAIENGTQTDEYITEDKSLC